MKSIFTDKKTMPSDADLQNSLGETYDLWKILADYVHAKHLSAFDEWSFFAKLELEQFHNCSASCFTLQNHLNIIRQIFQRNFCI